ncbi:MAG: type 1 glutamine amidotransferase [Candidatus Anammoxibacter sp.]
MSILFIKHIDIEGPGTLGEFLDEKGVPYEIVDVSNGNALPSSTSQYRAIVILGGPMNVYEEDKYPFLKAEDLLIKAAIIDETPMLGLCLGAQLIAKAAGAKVGTAIEKEIGWFKVKLTDNGINDPLFEGLSNEINVFQWHGDAFDIPANGIHLGSSKSCANQAFKYNSNVYGLQFHLEVTIDMVREWLDAYSDEIASMGNRVNREEIIEQAAEFAESYNAQARIFYENFLKIAKMDF